eukprot:6330303-Alexandrium_andersonii.AAC.1
MLGFPASQIRRVASAAQTTATTAPTSGSQDAARQWQVRDDDVCAGRRATQQNTDHGSPQTTPSAS